jgi:sec-independent protein translocase protein TatB
MFDIGFSELLVVGVVALIVVGPERLPKVARTAGLLLGRLQRYVGQVKADISREIQLEELKQLQSEMRETARDFERGMTDEIETAEQNIGLADVPDETGPDRTTNEPAAKE